MANQQREHWFNDYKGYWGGFILLVAGQAWITSAQTSWPPLAAFLIFFGIYLLVNVLVALIILLLTWPAKRNLYFSRYIKLLIAFGAVYFLSQVIAVLVTYFQR